MISKGRISVYAVLAVLAWALAVVMFYALPSYANAATTDPRYCGPPARDASGKIARSSQVLHDFRALYPCPATGRRTGACPDWAIDHVIPLACGGCDAVGNLQWLPNPAKSASGVTPKDRWERTVYCRSL